MSKIIDAVENAAYSMDWFKRRNNVLDAIVPYVYGADCTKRIIGQFNLKDNVIIRSLFFMCEDCLYVWTDIIENGKIESSQLEHIWESAEIKKMMMSYMIYRHDTHNKPIGPFMFQYLLDDKLEILEES